MELHTIGQAIRTRRELLRLSGREAARRASVSVTAWFDLEKGKHPPTAATQRGVARALSWPLDWLDSLDAGEAPVTTVTSTDLFLQANPGMYVSDELREFLAGRQLLDLDEARSAGDEFRQLYPDNGAVVSRVGLLEQNVTQLQVAVEALAAAVRRLTAQLQDDDDELPGDATPSGRASR